MQEGTVKWFNDKKGYGFIISEGVETDIIVHQTEIKMSGFRTLAPGQGVQFNLEHSEKGLHARNVIPGEGSNVRICPKCGHIEAVVPEQVDET